MANIVKHKEFTNDDYRQLVKDNSGTPDLESLKRVFANFIDNSSNAWALNYWVEKGPGKTYLEKMDDHNREFYVCYYEDKMKYLESL